MVDNSMIIDPITLQQLPFDMPLNFLTGHIIIHVSKPTVEIKM